MLHKRLLSLSGEHLDNLKIETIICAGGTGTAERFLSGRTNYKWNMGGRKSISRLHAFIADVCLVMSRMSFARSAWVRLNRLQTGVKLFRSTMRKWGTAPTAAGESAAREQTPEHVIASCPIYHDPNGARVLSAVDKSLVSWLKDTCPAI